jgi:ATP-dependent 26S proteasome regulatory subunit
MHTDDASKRHADLVAEQLRVTDQRIADSVEALATTDQDRAWLTVCAEREMSIDGVFRDDAMTPSAWPQARLGLSVTEARVLWVLIAHELSPLARARLRDLNTEQVSDVTLDTLRRVVYGSRPEPRAWHELAPRGTLRRRYLIEPVEDAPGAPEHRRTFRVARRVLALVHGDIALDDELAGIVELSDRVTPGCELEIDADARERVRASLDEASGLTVLQGRSGSGRRSLLLSTAWDAGYETMTIDARKISPQREAAGRQLRIIARECQLLRRMPVFLHLDALGSSNDVPDRLDLFEAELERFAVATTTSSIARRWRSTPTVIEVPTLTGRQRARLWERALPMASTGDAELLSTMYPLAPALIQAVGQIAIKRSNGSEMKPHHIEAGIRSVLDDRLAGLASRITVTQKWEDLILPEDQTSVIVELLSRIRKRDQVYEEWGFAEKVGRGLGVTALFSGPPGTGKTMCAGLIAADLGIELYQVDLSKITSKWIGETEKNLAALFDAAEAGHAILLFDEADALFGKRTTVQSSNDRHANQEVNYLLQRLETFAGICVLTTNHDSAIDEAFRRRLSVHVRFPIPDLEERAKLWRALLPEKAPIDPDLPFDDLAKKYMMSGGYIRNAVLRAAFMAADEDTNIGANHLVQAAQLEYEAMGKIATSHS